MGCAASSDTHAMTEIQGALVDEELCTETHAGIAQIVRLLAHLDSFKWWAKKVPDLDLHVTHFLADSPKALHGVAHRQLKRVTGVAMGKDPHNHGEIKLRHYGNGQPADPLYAIAPHIVGLHWQDAWTLKHLHGVINAFLEILAEDNSLNLKIKIKKLKEKGTWMYPAFSGPFLRFRHPGGFRFLREIRALERKWDSDDEFCRRYLQGISIFDFRRVTDLEKEVPQEFFTQKLISADEEKDGGIYLSDFKLLKPARAKPSGHIYYEDTVVVFREVSLDKAPLSGLEIVGIQLKENGPVFNKDDGFPYRYLLAKAYAANMAAQIMEFLWHLGLTHLAMEQFVAATHNAFHEKGHKNHLIYKLLEPHFAGTVAINWAARHSLIAKENASLDTTFSLGVPGGLLAVAAYYQNHFDFMKFNPEGMLGKRGLLDKSTLPRYYFRDDALRLWVIINEYVHAIVNVKYPDNDKAVADDAALQDFARQVHACTPTFPETIPDRATLTHVCATIIGIPTIFHSALNYAQVPFLFASPATPILLNKPMPSEADLKGKDVSKEYFLSAMPDKANAQFAAQVGWLLTTPTSVSLCEFARDDKQFKDSDTGRLDACKGAKKLLASQLKALSGEIETRDERELQASGSCGYVYLNPDNCNISVEI